MQWRIQRGAGWAPTPLRRQLTSRREQGRGRKKRRKREEGRKKGRERKKRGKGEKGIRS